MPLKTGLHLSNRKRGHTTSRSGRAAHGGSAMRGRLSRMEPRQVCSYRKQPSVVPSGAPRATVLNISSETQKMEILCKPSEKKRSHLSCGLSACYDWARNVFLFLVADQRTDADLSVSTLFNQGKVGSLQNNYGFIPLVSN